MDTGSILVGVAVVLLVAWVVAQPLLERRARHPAVAGEAERLKLQRDRLLVALRDLDFDHTLGKIQEADYTPLRAQLVAEGAAVLKQLEGLGEPSEEEAADLAEQAIAAHRQARAAGQTSTPAETPEDEVERAIAARRKARAAGKAGACPHCGAAVQPGDSFCPRCGATLARACPKCGAAAQADDKFCAKCGSQLPELNTKATP